MSDNRWTRSETFVKIRILSLFCGQLKSNFSFFFCFRPLFVLERTYTSTTVALVDYHSKFSETFLNNVKCKMEDMVLHRCAYLELNPTPIVEVFEPIKLPGDEFAPVDAVVKGRRVVPPLTPFAPIVIGEVQWVRLGQVCWERRGEVCFSSCSLVACRLYVLLVVCSLGLGGNGGRRGGWFDL